VNFKDETGSAVLEFIAFGILLQIPLLVFASNLVALQHDQLAAEAITRDVLRSFILLNRHPGSGTIELAEEYGVPNSQVKVTMSCAPMDCQQTKAWIFVETQIGRVSAGGAAQR
jgi:hypothetical protein